MKLKIKVFSLVYLPLCRIVLFGLSADTVTVELPAAVAVFGIALQMLVDSLERGTCLMEDLNISSFHPAVMGYSCLI